MTGQTNASSARVTVVVTTWNREAFVAASIESVLASRYEDFDLLVLDNASTDRTVEIAERFAARDERVQVVVNEANLGQFGNRSRALDHVRTPYLKFHDSDDVMYPHCLDVLVDALDRFPGAAFALSGPRYWPGAVCPALSTPAMSYEREFLGAGMFNLGPASALFRTDALRDLGGFPDEGPSSDYLFFLRACGHVDVVLAAADLFWYRVHDTQVLGSAAFEADRPRALARAWKALHAPDCPLAGRALLQARKNWVAALARLTWRDLRRRRLRRARRWFAEAGIRGRDLARYLRRPRRSATAGSTPS